MITQIVAIIICCLLASIIFNSINDATVEGKNFQVLCNSVNGKYKIEISGFGFAVVSKDYCIYSKNGRIVKQEMELVNGLGVFVNG